MKNRIRAIPPIAFLLFALIPITASAQDVGELKERFEAVRRVVDDPLTDEAGIRKARRELEQLAKSTREFEEGDLKPNDPKAELAKGIVDTLRLVESRLPADPGRRSGELRPGFPVPEFDDRKLLAKQAAQLDEAQKHLARHLRKNDEPGDEAEELLHAVSVAQEALAWEAGWPFTKAEAEEFRAGDRLSEEVYLSRLKRGIERVDKQIKAEHDINGRTAAERFVVHMSARSEGKERFARHLQKSRALTSFPGGAFREFDEEQADRLKSGPGRR